MRLDLGIDGVRLRPWQHGDETALVRYANDPAIAANLRDRFPHPYTPHHARAWIDHTLAEAEKVSFAIATESEAIGGIGLILADDVFRRSAEIGYWLAQPFWSRGIATQAVIALSGWAFSRLDLVRLWAGVFERNPASARVLEKAGYAFEGRLRKAVTKHGETLDLLLYARVRDD